MADSPRWCAKCERYGGHHTDRCPSRPEDAAREAKVRQVFKAEGWTRMARIDSLTPGDFIEIHDGYGEVVEISGPHGPLGTPPTTDWYTLRVRYERTPVHFVTPKHPNTVGPLKGDREVVCWS